MRKDYIGFALLKDTAKYRERVLKALIKEDMGIKEKTLLRIYVNNLNYNELTRIIKTLQVRKKGV